MKLAGGGYRLDGSYKQSSHEVCEASPRLKRSAPLFSNELNRHPVRLADQLIA